MRGPGMKQLDLGLHKDTVISERVTLQFRADAYNALNNVNLGLPVATLTSPFAGRIFGANSPRVLQLALKLKF